MPIPGPLCSTNANCGGLCTECIGGRCVYMCNPNEQCVENQCVPISTNTSTDFITISIPISNCIGIPIPVKINAVENGEPYNGNIDIQVNGVVNGVGVIPVSTQDFMSNGSVTYDLTINAAGYYTFEAKLANQLMYNQPIYKTVGFSVYSCATSTITSTSTVTSTITSQPSNNYLIPIAIGAALGIGGLILILGSK
ncbi:MAG: hypothetical protein QXP38_00685 [Nitrososphaerota archaeon]